MAEKLDEFNFGRMRSNRSSGYDEYLTLDPKTGEGEIWKLSPEDSASGTAEIRSMQSSISKLANDRGVKVRTNVVTEIDKNAKTKNKGGEQPTITYLVIQAYDPEHENQKEE